MIQRFKHGQKRWKRKFAWTRNYLPDPLTDEIVEIWLSFFWVEEKYVDPVYLIRQFEKKTEREDERAEAMIAASVLFGLPRWTETERWSFKKPQWIREGA